MENYTGVAGEASDEPPANLAMLMLIISSTIVVFGAAANAFIIISFCKVKSLRSVTNYFIVNLAVADIFLLITLSVWIICDKIPFGFTTEQVKIVMNILISMDVFCCSASLTSLACVSVDRCLAITRPLRCQTITTHSRAVIVLVGVWAYSSIIFVTSFIRDYVDSISYNTVYISSLFACTFILPIAITSASYYLIFGAVWRQVHHPTEQSNAGYRRSRFIMKEFRVAVNILVTILPIYFMWGGFWIDALQEAILEREYNYPPVVSWLIGIAPHVAAAVNPIIYISMTRDFRLLFVRLLACKRRQGSNYSADSRQRTTSTRSCSTQHGVQMVDVVYSDEFTKSITVSEDTKSSSGQCISTDSSCVTVSPTDEKPGFPPLV